MSSPIHPAAPHILPIFITEPGQTDVFLVGSGIFLILLLFGLGTFYFRLHALPEHIAHGNAGKLQLELIAVLALLGLFLHNTAFWIAALLLALVPIPDLYAPFSDMASSLANIAGWRRKAPPPDGWPPPAADAVPVARNPSIEPAPEPMTSDTVPPQAANHAAAVATETETPPATPTGANRKSRPGKGHES